MRLIIWPNSLINKAFRLMATSGGSRRVARLKARSQAKSDAHATIARKALGDSRVSTDEQAEHGHSLENQERALPRRARRLRARARAHRGRRLLGPPGVEARPASLAHAVTTVADLMVRFNVQLRSVTEPIDTAMRRTLFAVLSGRAEQELKNIVERTANGRAKARKGGFAGGAVPYGSEPDGGGGLCVVPHEALIIRRMSERGAE